MLFPCCCLFVCCLSYKFVLCVVADAGASVSISPSTIKESSALVNVTFSRGSTPDKDDWIGVWLLATESATIDPKQQAPTKYQVQIKILNCKYINV